MQKDSRNQMCFETKNGSDTAVIMRLKGGTVEILEGTGYMIAVPLVHGRMLQLVQNLHKLLKDPL